MFLKIDIMKQHFALITGASSGIGFQYAREMARRNYNLIVVSNVDEIYVKAEALCAEFPSVEVVPMVCDLGTSDAARILYDSCSEYEVEVLINNAGVYHDCDFIDDSEAFNKLILNLHINTPAMLVYYFAKDMADRGKGYILNMSSITNRIAVQRLSTYASTKAFLSSFTRSVHVELRYKGVSVTCVRPGAVDTGLFNISPFATKMGLLLGYIVKPEYLAHRAVKAMFRGCADVTIPWFWNKLLMFLVALLPTCMLRLIRRWGIF